MGYGIVPDIKDEAVVCQKPCTHPDCAMTRKDWTGTLCAICKEPMLAGQAFYYNDDKKPEHAHCVWDEAEKAKAAV